MLVRGMPLPPDGTHLLEAAAPVCVTSLVRRIAGLTCQVSTPYHPREGKVPRFAVDYESAGRFEP